MIYITGDTHASFDRFSTKRFPEQKEMTRNDYVIICGDFGGIWTYGKSDNTEQYWLDWLGSKPFTLLFVDGNHENYDRLKMFPIVNYHGGKAHKIRENIYHLMRGYVFEFEEKKFFAFGGASSHDIQDGILDIKDYDSVKKLVDDYNKRTRQGQMLRINNLSWWKEELPSKYEMQRGRDNLRKVDYKVDYVISHCLPQSVVTCLYGGKTSSDIETRYFDKLLQEGLIFNQWFSGHYHLNEHLFGEYTILYKDIMRLT